MLVKTKDLYFKSGYRLRVITQREAEELELNSQLYVKIKGVAYPIKISKCFENAEKFEVDIIK